MIDSGMLGTYIKQTSYPEKHFVIGVREGESRIELLYPTPFMRKEDVELLRQKYEEKIKKLMESVLNMNTEISAKDI